MSRASRILRRSAPVSGYRPTIFWASPNLCLFQNADNVCNFSIECFEPAHLGRLLFLDLRFRRYKLQEVFNAALQDRADSSEDINIQARDLVVAIMIDLGSLHFSPMAELVFADPGFLDQFVEFDSDRTVVLHVITPLSSKMFDFSCIVLVDIDTLL